MRRATHDAAVPPSPLDRSFFFFFFAPPPSVSLARRLRLSSIVARTARVRRSRDGRCTGARLRDAPLLWIYVKLDEDQLTDN
jgi:hypothetical protein